MSKLSWQAKLTGLIVLVLGAMLLFQLLYVSPHVKDREVQREQTHQEEIVRNIALQLDSDLQWTRDRLVELSGRAEFAGMDIASQQRTLDTIAEGSLRFGTLAVMDAGGWFVSMGGVEDVSIYTTRSYADERYFYVPFGQGETYWQEPRFYPSEQLLSVAVSVPIESDTGGRVGVLLGTLRLNHLVEMVQDYPLQEGMVITVVDTEGRVLAHSGIDLFALEEGPLSLDYSEHRLVQAIALGETGVFPDYEHDGVPWYGAYTILDSNGWGVVVGRPMGLVLAEANALSRWMLTANAVLFAIALLVALLLGRQIMTGQRKAEQALYESRDELRLLAQRVEEVREEERTGLARELHDTAGQAITALKLDVSQLKKRLEQGQAPTPEELDALDDLLGQTADDVRRISSELRPGVLDDIGLDGAIEWQIDESKKRTDLDFTVNLPPEECKLDEARRTALFRVFQELLTNVVRHADARSVRVTLERADDAVTLTVADDGCGVDVEQLEASSSIGIIGMRERLRPHGGELHYDTAPGKGTTARVVMPVA